MPPVWLQLLALALQAAPTVQAEITAAINDHWGKDHVAQIQHGLGVLSQVTASINAAAVAAQAPPAPPPAA